MSAHAWLVRSEHVDDTANSVDSVPPGAFLLVLLAMSMPAGFPYESHPLQGILTYFKMAALRKVDFLGTI